MITNSDRILGLDLGRCVAALLIMIAHGSYLFTDSFSGSLYIAGLGHQAVSFFLF